MASKSLSLIACPREWRSHALRVALRDLPSEQRESIATSADDTRGLFVAVVAGELVGACWVQPQPGNTAILWPPQMLRGTADAADQLLAAATDYLEQRGVGLTQTLLSERHDRAIPLLERCGFVELAELVYLSWESAASHPPQTNSDELTFEQFQPTKMQRLAALIEQTYEGTLDCPLMNGARHMDDVLAGYQATGEFQPDRWWFAQRDGRDVGVLLLTTHQAIRHMELMYMGVVPAARGYGCGAALIRHAQRATVGAQLDRLVLAVDVANGPATRIYHRAGFRPWDRRVVFVRFPGGRREPTASTS